MSSKLPFDPKNGEQRDPFAEIMNQMNNFFLEKPVRGILQSIDEFFKTPFPLSSFQIDLKENEKEHIVMAELPGVNKEQIQINVLGNSLSISVNNREEITEEDQNNQSIRKRHSMSRSTRTVPFPFPINEQSVKASYKDGLLEIRVPKQKGKNIIIDHE
jgi:HSP20 family protein